MLLIKNGVNEHVSSDITNEFESVILLDENVMPATINKYAFKVAFFVFRIARKLGISTIFRTRKHYLKKPLEDQSGFYNIISYTILRVTL